MGLFVLIAGWFAWFADLIVVLFGCLDDFVLRFVGMLNGFGWVNYCGFCLGLCIA